VPVGRFEYLSEADDFLMKGAARGRTNLVTFGTLFLKLVDPGHAGLHPVDAVVLNLSCRDLGKNHVTKERIQMVLDPSLVAFDIDLASLSLCDGFEFIDEPGGSFLEGFAFLDLAAPVLAEQAQVPVARHVFGARKAFLFCGRALLPSGNGACAPPMRAFGPHVELDSVVHLRSGVLYPFASACA
jgi:hypothetical protein